MVWMILLACGGDDGADPPPPPADDTAVTPADPLPEPDLIQSVSWVHWPTWDDEGDLSVDLARTGSEMCVVTTKESVCRTVGVPTGCVQIPRQPIAEPFHVTAHGDDGLLLDCVVIDDDAEAPAGCRPLALQEGTPPACREYEPDIAVDCGPTSTTLDVWWYEGTTYDAHVTGTDETGIVVDTVFTVYSGYEHTYGCIELPACPPEALTWTITKLGTDTCAMAAPEFDAAWPCTQTHPVLRRSLDEDPVCAPDPTTR